MNNIIDKYYIIISYIKKFYFFIIDLTFNLWDINYFNFYNNLKINLKSNFIIFNIKKFNITFINFIYY